jgi:uncharacterized protein (TIGR00288 family)
MEQIQNIALFIDGDNVNKTTFQENFDEIKLKGRICIKRIYFDFTEKMDEKWKSIILNNGIESISVINLPNKNSTDIKLMLDMIKEYYNNPIIDTYIIMSSDSDFYHIATFLRSSGKKVICYGEKHTPPMLKNVCDEFILCKKTRKPEKLEKTEKPKKPKIILETYDDEENLYQDIIQIDNYIIDKSEINNNNWKNYYYYKEYNDKIYILRDVFEKILFINNNKNLENKNLSYLKDLLLQSDPSFSEKNWNFNSFKEFIKCLFNKEIETSYDQTKRYEYISKVTF